MSFSRNTLLTTVFAFGTLALVAHDVQACKGGSRSGGFSGGFSRSYSSHSSYSRPVQHNSYSQPVRVIRQVQTVRPVQTVSAPPVIQQPAPVQQISQPQPVVAPQPAPQPAPIQTNTASMSALQALGGFAPPQAIAPQQVQTAMHIGNWTATLGNGATVSLTLQADGNFSWVAANASGATSSFSGSYTVDNGSLSLNRSNDGQQLSGNMTTTGNDTFSFQLAGNNAAAINFNRS